jgi:hypothetical protein
MTGAKELLKARHAKFSKELADKEQKRAELVEAISKLQKLMADIDDFERDLDRAFSWPPDKPLKPNQTQKLDRRGHPTKYNRRPPTWKGRRGYEFLSGIVAIQARDKCGIAAAIRELKKNEPGKWPEEVRALQRRYQEIEGDWKPWHQLEQMLEAEAAALLAKDL